jgi:hypothetical protein
MSNVFEPGGYPFETDEGRRQLALLPDDSEVLQLVGSYEEIAFDPREVIQVENQKSQGACAGHSLSSVIEWCLTLATGKTGAQLSRAAGYYETQRIDGIRGDKGSTINGGVKLAMNWGLPIESLWPYPDRYDPSRPRNWDAVTENAAQHKIGRSTRITSYDGWRAFLGSGQGGIHTGIAWSSNVMSKPIVETYSPGGGGHSICALVLSDRLDRQGRPYSWILNSWSKTFGNQGWQEWSPTAIEQMLKSNRTTFVGLSDLPNVKPRELSLDDLKRKLRQ